MKKFLAAVAFTAALAAASSSAYAKCSSGFIANALCKTGIISKQDANNLDGAHAAIGNPLDHIAADAAQVNGVPLTPYCATSAGIGLTNFGLPGTPCAAGGYSGVRVQG